MRPPHTLPLARETGDRHDAAERHGEVRRGGLGLNSAFLFAGLGSSQLLTLVLYALVARSVAPAVLGPLLAAVGVSVLLVTVGDFGINNWATRHLRSSPAATGTFHEALTLRIVLGTVVGIAWIGCCLGLGRKAGLYQNLAPLGLYVAAAVSYTAMLVPLRAMQRMDSVALVQGLERVASLVIALPLLAWRPSAPWILPAALAFGALAAVVASCIVVERRYLRLAQLTSRSIWDISRGSLGLAVASSATHLYRADVAVVALAAGATQAGLYGGPARISWVLSILPAAFGNAVFARVAGGAERTEGHREALRVGAAVLLLMSAAVILIVLLARPLVRIFLGDAYLAGVSVLQIYAWGWLFLSMSQPMAFFLMAERRDWFVAAALVSSSVLGLVSIGLGSLWFGADGGAVGFVVLEALVFAALLPTTYRTIAGGPRAAAAGTEVGA